MVEVRDPSGALCVLLFLAWGVVLAPVATATDLGVTIVNVAPTLSSVTVAASVNPTAGSTTSVDVTVIVSDLNGYNDVASVSVLVLKPDGSTTHISSGSASFSSGSTVLATYTHSFSMNFYDDAATGSTKYKVRVTATDSAGASVDNLASLAGFNYAELAAVSLSSSSLTFGGVSPGDASGASTQTVTNRGNVVIDVQVSGTDLTLSSPSATIPVSAVSYSLQSDMSSSAALSNSAASITSFDLAKGASSSKSLYLKLTVPSGADQYLPAGAYAGTLTVTAIAG